MRFEDQMSLADPLRSVPAQADGKSIAGIGGNAIKRALASGSFLYTLEYVPDLSANRHRALDELARNAELVGRDPRIAAVNIGDRVKSLDSVSTVECGRVAAEASGKTPLLHLAGKDRLPHEARDVIDSALALGLDNLLLLTGDGITEERAERVRYHESVVAICETRERAPDAVIAAAVSPFKYREEELANQYLKMVKKIASGASYLITNCGWDMRKLQELIWYRDARGFHTPIVANLLLPSMGWARGIHSRRLPGVFMSDDLFVKISQEHEQGKTRARELAWQRLALQIVGSRLMGYAGVQLSGIEVYEDLCTAIEMAHDVGARLTSLDEWQSAWDDVNRLPGGRVVDFAPPGGAYLFESRPAHGSLDRLPEISGVAPSEQEKARYQRLKRTHDLVFDQEGPFTSLFSGVVKLGNRLPGGRDALLSLEKLTKHTVLGCETCGFCRTEYLFYNCPETCPKGLANGPCAGTDENTCEFKDRECIHNRKYRLAKQLGRLDELESVYVPPVEGTRGSSSWANHFAGSTPKIVWIQPAPPTI
ncbi:MAG: methylenetetrahydrofolate reductase C-terminal domain-containing protein [Burkholderiaceae bacterium]